MKLNFVLNDKEINIDTRADRRVVDLLREDLGLTGTKEGCGTGECGACTILVDGEGRLSCLMVAAQLEGSRVTTVEGLEQTPEGILIRQAFVVEGAVQCGFCTPGMEMATMDLLRRDRTPSRERIREGLSGNLCRCTGYVKIVDAVGKAA
ncbi:MAG TPA: (2Fe-2S)-binding protein, partial [Desulfuromonadaceae bacterium]